MVQVAETCVMSLTCVGLLARDVLVDRSVE